MAALGWICVFIRAGYKSTDAMSGDMFKRIVSYLPSWVTCRKTSLQTKKSEKSLHIFSSVSSQLKSYNKIIIIIITHYK